MKTLRYIYSALAAMCLTVFAGCSPEELSTDQYTDNAVALSAYGPQPVARGGELRFLGSNLDRIVSVVIPGVDPVTEIEVVQAGVPSEIRIIVPKDGPEPGLLTLVADDGTEIVTKTELTYSEPIVLDGFSPASVKPGDVITITGDYLNLINEVVFAEEVIVSGKEFIEHDRYRIQVKVPAEAQTGEIGLGDLDMTLPENDGLFPNVVYSEESLTVAVPSVTEMTASVWKAGETVTITGTDLDLAASVDLPGEVSVTELSLNDANTSLTFVLPAEAQDGEAYVVTASGIEILAGNYVTVIPSELSVSPETPVNPGDKLTVSGQDLDLVASVSLPNSGEVEGWQLSEGSITFAVPETAQEGDITLTMANGKTATVSFTLVKPANITYNPNPVSAGSELTITGDNLNLVTGIVFGGDVSVAIETAAETITVTVPTAAVTGALTFNLSNGGTMEAPELQIDTPESCYITELPSEDEEIYAGTVLVVPVENGDVLTGVQVNGADTDYLLSSGSLYISLPMSAGASTAIRLVSSNGVTEYTIDCISNSVTERVIWTGELVTGNWSSSSKDLAEGKFDWSSIDLSAGNVTLVAELEQDPSASWWQFNLKSPAEGWPDFTNKIFVEMTKGQTVVEVPLTQAMLDEIIAANGVIITGCNYTLYKITIRTEPSGSGSETEVWSGNTDLGTGWSTSVSVTNTSVFQSLSSGATLHVAYTTAADETNAQLKIMFASDGWPVIPSITDADPAYGTVTVTAGEGEISYKISDADLETIKTSGMVVGGQKATVTRIYFTE